MCVEVTVFRISLQVLFEALFRPDRYLSRSVYKRMYCVCYCMIVVMNGRYMTTEKPRQFFAKFTDIKFNQSLFHP